MLIGERLRQLREQKGLSQKELATVAGLDDATISHLEKDRRHVTANHAMKLAEVFGMTTSEFWAAIETETA
jgi:transcriptional regulator with XRE-family HTH domain